MSNRIVSYIGFILDYPDFFMSYNKCFLFQFRAEHEMKHTGKAKFLCSLCPSKFATESRLNVHMKVAHCSDEDKIKVG